MGLSLEILVELNADNTRLMIKGEGCEIFVHRRAALLDALQHLVNAVFRHKYLGHHIIVDCLDYRKSKDAELRETTKILVARARETGEPQEVGPLNPYTRRMVHLVVAEDKTASSESVGDAFMKTVIITAQ